MNAPTTGKKKGIIIVMLLLLVIAIVCIIYYLRKKKANTITITNPLAKTSIVSNETTAAPTSGKVDQVSSVDTTRVTAPVVTNVDQVPIIPINSIVETRLTRGFVPVDESIFINPGMG